MPLELVLRSKTPTAGREARKAKSGVFGGMPEGNAAATASGRCLFTASSAVILAREGLCRKIFADVAFDPVAWCGTEVAIPPVAGLDMEMDVALDPVAGFVTVELELDRDGAPEDV